MAAKKAAKDAAKAELAASSAEGAAAVAEMEKRKAAQRAGEKRPETRQLQPAARQGCQKRGEEVRRLGRREGEATRAPDDGVFSNERRGEGERRRARETRIRFLVVTTNPVRSRSSTSR
jgi:hypothetical protein